MQIQTVSKSQFKAKALEYMRFVEQNNQSLIITHQGKPVIQMKSYSPQDKLEDDLKFFRGTLKKYIRPMDPVGVEDWEVLK